MDISGYKEQSELSIAAVNHTKHLENELGDWIESLRSHPEYDADKRWLAIAVTDLQKGFMALNRAVFKPESRLK